MYLQPRPLPWCPHVSLRASRIALLIMSQTKFLISTSTNFLYPQFSHLNRELLLPSNGLIPRLWGRSWGLSVSHTPQAMYHQILQTVKMYPETWPFLKTCMTTTEVWACHHCLLFQYNFKHIKQLPKLYKELPYTHYSDSLRFSSFLQLLYIHSSFFPSLSQTHKHVLHTHTQVYMHIFYSESRLKWHLPVFSVWSYI